MGASPATGCAGSPEIIEEANLIINQYFATLNPSRSYAETRFLMTVQAAEAYHRDRLLGGGMRDKNSLDT